MTPPSPARPPVIVVTGPTAAGKTGLSLAIALRFGGEVVNADSMQVYRHMDIGTAKPSPEQRAQVPHHVLDVVTPDVPYDAGRYLRDARAAAARVHERGRPVVLTGGTGLYVRAFLEGLAGVGGADAELRGRLEREQERAQREGDPERLHRRLGELDPEAARPVHPNDLRRVVRALEIVEGTGRSASSARREHAFADRPYEALYLVLDPGRERLGERIDRRAEAMIEAGLLREVRHLRDRGYGPELRPMQAIGYRHIQPVVDGSDTLANALVGIQRDTRRFARRQRTWFRGVAEAEWWDPDEQDELLRRVERFLEDAERGRMQRAAAPGGGGGASGRPT